ncbi:20664_t:CDS:1 [Gigaspora margarita]|uniref:20664_t:CDS:1 n=1 Tax=Gigaspora margarita TaxID=4874 RepID=A0ABN7VQI6_GIGMA|nr:20664_t:CDS:1 [Gigaspora margarita]
MENFEAAAPELCKVALRILTILSSSAASERNWSNFSYIHDKKRNRLTPSQVLKLVYIYSNYKLTCPKLESSDIMEATIWSNNRPCENYKFELLDPDDNNESSEDELIESSNKDKDTELSKSEMELLSESNVDSEDDN